MKCRTIQKRLSAYLDSELELAERERIEAHLKDCPECRKQCERFLHAWDALGDFPDIQPGQDFHLQLGKRTFEADQKRFVPRLRPVFQILPSPLAMATLLFVGLVTGIYLGNVVFEEGLTSFQSPQPGHIHAHTSLESFRTFDTVPPGTLAHGYLTMASCQEETR